MSPDHVVRSDDTGKQAVGDLRPIKDPPTGKKAALALTYVWTRWETERSREQPGIYPLDSDSENRNLVTILTELPGTT